MLIETDMIDEANNFMEERYLAFKKNNIKFEP
jgi:hypothetical protein